MSIYRKMLSLILSVLIFLSLIPPVSLNAKPESGNYPEYIEVTVLADKKNGDYNVPAEGAVVTLKNGETVLLQALSDAEGKVSFDISGLDPELLKNATVQAYITADRGKGINGSARDDLFSHFPKDESGEYYRYEYQLHSENIDEDGNWRGHELPFSVSDALDIVFVIDGTGSMYDRLDNVKKNLSDYIRGITGLGWDVRYSVLEYRDYFTGELPVLHEADGSHWYRNEDDVIAELEKIQADGGGDLDESLNDALDSVIVSNNIDFRRNSCRLPSLSRMQTALSVSETGRSSRTAGLENISVRWTSVRRWSFLRILNWMNAISIFTKGPAGSALTLMMQTSARGFWNLRSPGLEEKVRRSSLSFPSRECFTIFRFAISRMIRTLYRIRIGTA